MKKIVFPIVAISLIISLIFNIYQFKTINNYKQKQHFNDEEIVATIGRLNYYLDKIDFKAFNEENIRDCLSMSERIYTLVKNSTYSSNSYIVDCFNDLDNVFTGLPTNKIKNIGEQIKVLLKSTININDKEINIDGCKKLSKFIRSNM
jgi:hypothetical protein